MAMGCLVGGASAGVWVAERNRCGLGEKDERGFKKELRDRVGGPRELDLWWEERILQVCCGKAKSCLEK